MFFLILNSINIDFLKEEIRQKFYTIKKVFSTIKQV